MLIPNQKIEMAWSTSNREWYENRGYVFSKYRDKFYINPEDLSRNSKKKIKCTCDKCAKEKVLDYKSYCDNIERNNGFYSCYNCKFKNAIEHSKKVDRSTTKNRMDINKVIKIIEDKKDTLLNPDDYININSPNLKIKYGCCGAISKTSLSSIKNSNGLCYNCGLHKNAEYSRLSAEQVEYEINSVNNNTLLNPNEYVNYNTINLKILCGECKNNVFVTSIANYKYNNKIRCDNCSQKISDPERRAIKLLGKYKINFISEYKFDNCKDKRRLPFDFYIPEINTIIELDGEHHYHAKWGEENLKKTRYHDKIKNEYCKNNNINLIRIPFWDFDNLENILIEKLNLPQIVDAKLSNG